MSNEDEQLCMSELDVHGGAVRIQCNGKLGHDGLHVGRELIGEDGYEVHQWTDAAAVDDNASASELPVWYHALPLDKVVDVHSRGGGYSDVLLSGVVVDDHEQPGAIRVSWRESENGMPSHALVPWHAVSAIEWGEQ